MQQGIWACPYCATNDSIGGGLSVYIPLAGIIISPFIIVGGVVYYIKSKR